MTKRFALLGLSLLIVCLSFVPVAAQTTAFTYQGKLADNGSPANGNYDLIFKLYDTADVAGGAQQGPTLSANNVAVSAGVFTAQLDFGACSGCFNGASRFLEIAVRPSGAGSFTTLSPRQPISSTPYAVRSLSATTADLATNAQQLGGVAAGQFVQGSDARLADARTPTAGSSNYIQNSSSPQSAANFNISGDGTAAGTLSGNVLNAGTQFNINGNRVLSVTGSGMGAMSNTFAGKGAGTLTTPSASINAGNFNSFFGANAGTANTTGFFNSFIGFNAGSQNTTGSSNSFFGMRAGNSNTTGFSNSFFGAQAGDLNTTGSFNSFFGIMAGRSNTTGATNSFVGHSAGSNNLAGSGNTFVGVCAGCANGSGSHNSFFGENAGTSNSSEEYNTFLGASANGATGITNSTAIGSNAKVTESNSLVLGSINGINGATADTKVGIGTTSPLYKLQVVDAANTGLRVQTNAGGGTVASFGTKGDFQIDRQVGGFPDPVPGGRFVVKENGWVGIGKPFPGSALDVHGFIRSAFSSGGTTQLCANSLSEISQCSSSRRYKTDFRPFTSGLSLINRLHPLTFRWKSDQKLDLGLGAEDVAAVEPLLVTHNQKGEIEGVKYDRVAVVLINAVKEQQNQIEQQRRQIDSLLKTNAGLGMRLQAVERRLQKRMWHGRPAREVTRRMRAPR